MRSSEKNATLWLGSGALVVGILCKGGAVEAVEWEHAKEMHLRCVCTALGFRANGCESSNFLPSTGFPELNLMILLCSFYA